MCLPLGCVKHVLSFFSFITIVIGIGGLVAGSVYLAQYGAHLDFDNFNPTTVSTALLLGTGIIAIFIGIIGMVGSKKKSKCCLCIYQFAVFPLFALSLAVACLSTYANIAAGDMEDVKDQLSTCKWNVQECEKCGNDNSLEWVKEFNLGAFYATNDVLGRSPDCQILASDDGELKAYKKLGFEFVTTDSKQEGAVKSAQDCKLNNEQQEQDGYQYVKPAGNFLSYFEQEFKCSGMCVATPFYAFYDTTQPIDNNRPSCYSKIVDFMESTTVLIISWSVWGFFLLNLILACCVCCHPDKKGQDYKSVNGAYSRMNYYD